MALARRLAALIEDAEAVAGELDELRPEDESTAAALARLKAKVDAHAVASDLAPKYLAVLAALGLTPVARAAVKGAAPAPAVASGPADRLAQLRAVRRPGVGGSG